MSFLIQCFLTPRRQSVSKTCQLHFTKYTYNQTMPHLGYYGYLGPTHYYLPFGLMQEARNWQTLSAMSQTVNGFSGHKICAAGTQLLHGNAEAATDTVDE